MLLETVGGKTPHFQMRNMLAFVMADTLGVNYSFCGAGGKKEPLKGHRVFKLISHSYQARLWIHGE